MMREQDIKTLNSDVDKLDPIQCIYEELPATDALEVEEMAAIIGGLGPVKRGEKRQTTQQQ